MLAISPGITLNLTAMLEMKKKNFFSYIRSFLGEKKKNTNAHVQLSNETIQDLKLRLSTLMNEEKPFLKQGYHMKDLADDLRIPVYQLSAFINQVFGVHFNDYINKFRISYCEAIIKTEPARHSFKELAYKCGFNNRNSFAAAFKKFTGQKPSDYVKRL